MDSNTDLKRAHIREKRKKQRLGRPDKMREKRKRQRQKKKQLVNKLIDVKNSSSLQQHQIVNPSLSKIRTSRAFLELFGIPFEHNVEGMGLISPFNINEAGLIPCPYKDESKCPFSHSSLFPILPKRSNHPILFKPSPGKSLKLRKEESLEESNSNLIKPIQIWTQEDTISLQSRFENENEEDDYLLSNLELTDYWKNRFKETEKRRQKRFKTGQSGEEWKGTFFE